MSPKDIGSLLHFFFGFSIYFCSFQWAISIKNFIRKRAQDHMADLLVFPSSKQQILQNLVVV